MLPFFTSNVAPFSGITEMCGLKTICIIEHFQMCSQFLHCTPMPWSTVINITAVRKDRNLEGTSVEFKGTPEVPTQLSGSYKFQI